MDHVRVGGGASNETLGAKQMDTVQLIGGFGVAIANCMHGHRAGSQRLLVAVVVVVQTNQQQSIASGGGT